MRPKRPKGTLTKIAEIIPIVKQNLGLDKQLKINALKEVWPLITSFEIAENSFPSYFDKENNLVIAVKSSSLATELLMMKTDITKRLQEATKDTDIRFKNIRFLVKS